MKAFDSAGNSQSNDISILRGGGRMLDFGTASDLMPSSDINDRVTKLVDASGNVTGWIVYNAASDATERYDVAGRLQSSTARNGQVQNYSYSDSNTPTTSAPGSGFLLRVSDAFGRQLNFTYDSTGRMATMTNPAGGVYTYAYDEESSIVLPGNIPPGNLTSVTYPDGQKRIYWYNEQDKTSNANQPYALTGITDENGARFATYRYNATGKAVSTEHANGIQKYTVAYPVPNSQSAVTDPLGTVRTYNYQTILNLLRSTGETQSAGSGSASASKLLTYDANANVASSTDFNGTKTCYKYDTTRNLETVRVEGLSAGADCSTVFSATMLAPSARKISTEWKSNYRLPLRVMEPKRITTFTYDANGNRLSKTVQATTDVNGILGASAAAAGAARTWTYTYNAVGQVLTATGPRTDVPDVTTYTYDTQGNVSSVTNPLGQTTTLTNYDANGRAGRIVDVNGLVTDLAYSPRGWLLSKSVTGNGVAETTTYGYDGVGQLTNVVMPDTSTVSYTYDDAHRLTNIADSLGNSIAYTLDAMGNRINEQVKDPIGTLGRQTTRVYDALNRLQKITGATQ